MGENIIGPYMERQSSIKRLIDISLFLKKAKLPLDCSKIFSLLLKAKGDERVVPDLILTCYLL